MRRGTGTIISIVVAVFAFVWLWRVGIGLLVYGGDDLAWLIALILVAVIGAGTGSFIVSELSMIGGLIAAIAFALVGVIALLIQDASFWQTDGVKIFIDLCFSAALFAGLTVGVRVWRGSYTFS